jgi:hypothetical protein
MDRWGPRGARRGGRGGVGRCARGQTREDRVGAGWRAGPAPRRGRGRFSQGAGSRPAGAGLGEAGGPSVGGRPGGRAWPTGAVAARESGPARRARPRLARPGRRGRLPWIGRSGRFRVALRSRGARPPLGSAGPGKRRWVEGSLLRAVRVTELGRGGAGTLWRELCGGNSVAGTLWRELCGWNSVAGGVAPASAGRAGAGGPSGLGSMGSCRGGGRRSPDAAQRGSDQALAAGRAPRRAPATNLLGWLLGGHFGNAL